MPTPYSKAVTLRPNGSLTLPKKLRSKYKTMHYVAMEVSDGVLLKPVDDIEYYERKDGSFGLRFPNGIEMGKLAKMMRQAIKNLDRQERGKKAARARRRKNADS